MTAREASSMSDDWWGTDSLLLLGIGTWAVLGAVVLAGVNALGGEPVRTWAHACVVLLAVAWVLCGAVVIPVRRALSRWQVGARVQFGLLVVGGASLGIPCWLLGLLWVDDSTWWMAGTLPGLWCTVLGGLTVRVLRGRPKVQLVLLMTTAASSVAATAIDMSSP